MTMKTKGKGKKEQKINGKNISYILIIMLIFTPLSFLIANSISSSPGNYPDCYTGMKYNLTPSEEEEQQKQMAECESQFEEQQSKHRTEQFIIVNVIALIAILATLFFSKQLAKTSLYGLFFGGTLNVIISLIKESGEHSILASAIGIVLFIVIIIFINKNQKE